MDRTASSYENSVNYEVSTERGRGEINMEPPSKDFFNEASFQNVPSLLLIDLSRKNANGESVLELQDIAVYALLKSHSRQKGNCYPSHTRLAELAAVSPSTIQRSLRRLEDAGHIQRKNHNKGKIIMLTDVAANSKIVHRQKTAFVPRPREVCPPEFQDVVRDTSEEIDIFENEFRDESVPEQKSPVSEEAQPPREDEEPF